jgi:molybdopterin adenylyltransferase
MAIVRCGILTVSDRSSRGERPDSSGPVIAAILSAAGWQIQRQAIVPDELDKISSVLVDWCDSGDVDLIITTGGTGFSRRDVTPEATQSVIEKLAPGIAEGMRAESMKKTPHAMLSRGIAGIRKYSLIINLPGSPKAVAENLQFVLPVLNHAVDLIKNDPGSEDGHSFLKG